MRLNEQPPNNIMQRSSLRAAADAERWEAEDSIPSAALW